MRSILFILIGVISFEGFAIPKQLVCETVQTQKRLDGMRETYEGWGMLDEWDNVWIHEQPKVGETYITDRYTFDTDNLKSDEFQVIRERENFITNEITTKNFQWSVSPKFITWDSGYEFLKLNRKTLVISPENYERQPCEIVDLDTSSNQL